MGSKQSRGSRSFLGGADYGGPVADGNIRILNSVECGGEIFSLRYTEDGTDVCVGLLDGSIKVIQGVPYYWAHFLSAIFSASGAHTEEFFIAIG